MRTPTAAAGSALFFAVAPGVVAGLIPWWLTGWRVHGTLSHLAPVRIAGLVMLVLGAIVLVQAFARFAAEGHGTPAPVAPAERLVIGGLYRHVRNPMYIGVLSVVLGQASLYRSRDLLIYAACFWLAAHLFVVFYEEPTLKRQFGPNYEDYSRQVPRWIPRPPRSSPR